MDDANDSAGSTATEVAALTALVQALKALPRVALFVAPRAENAAKTTRNSTKGACQKLNATNSFQHAPFQLQRV